MTVEKLPQEEVAQKLDVPAPTQEDLLKMIKFKPSVLIWENFHVKQPEFDRWIYLWCSFGKLGQNIFVTYRNSLGQYDLPHPTKQFPAHAWAYADNPVVEEQVNATDAS